MVADRLQHFVSLLRRGFKRPNHRVHGLRWAAAARAAGDRHRDREAAVIHTLDNSRAAAPDDDDDADDDDATCATADAAVAAADADHAAAAAYAADTCKIYICIYMYENIDYM